MPLREDILVPIPGENPCGVDLRYDTKLLVFDKIKEARRQDDELDQGAWQSERKTANWPLVIKLAQDTLATTSKNLQLGAYLTEALLQTERFAGLRQGLELVNRLATEFWDTVYPVIDPEDPETREDRATPLGWLNTQLDLPIRSTPINNAGHSFINYKDSRVVGYEDQPKTDKDKKARATMIANGKLAPEIFDKAFNETPKAFYLQSEKDLDACLETISKLDAFCDAKLGNDSPGFGKIKSALTDVRQVIHQLLEKKREKEPDPVEVVPVEEAAVEGAAEDEQGAPIAAGSLGMALVGEPADRRQAIGGVVAAAAFLRKKEPFSPSPYLLLRGLRWGELRSATSLIDSPLLEAPPTELRQQIKRLALAKRWADLLEAGEQAMAQPGSRAWLDLQRLSVAACTALGKEYLPIATAIQSELRALLNDLPDLLDATLLDDTPAANPETKAWLKSLSAVPQPVPGETEEAAAEVRAHRNGAPTWLASAVDAYTLAQDALASGQEEKAFAIMRAEVSRQRSGRRRFRRMMQTVELAIAAGKDSIAQPLLEDIAATIENHKLDAWEDPELIASDLIKLMRYSKKIQGSSSDKQKLFERICRLDPVQALSVG
jgi:type VI secretion system protein ImpA